MTSTRHVYAADNSVNALNYSLYQISTDIQEQLNETQKITASEIKKLFNENAIVEPKVFKYKDQVNLTTASNGVVKTSLNRSYYKLDISSITGYDITLPKNINIRKAKNIVAIGLRPGSGKVTQTEGDKKSVLASISNWFDNKVLAEETTSEISVVTYYDKNNNGRWDRSEKIVPWAGVTLKLTDENADLKNSGSDVSFFDNIPFFKIKLGPSQ